MITDKHNKRTLEELLALSNEQIIGKWSVLASLIRLNEYGESNPKDQSKGWHPSREKAIYLLNTDSAEEYIDKVRGRYSSQPLTPLPDSPILDVGEEIPIFVQSEPPKKKAKTQKALDIEAKNYERFLRLVPNFEERVVSDDDLNGFSEVPGFHGMMLLDCIMKDDHIVVFELFHLVEFDQEYMNEASFTIELNLAKETLEPLEYRYKGELFSVFHSVEGVKNLLIDLKEKDRQNESIATLFRNLIRFNHSFKALKDEHETEMFHSLLKSGKNYGRDKIRLKDKIESNLDDVRESISSLKENQEFLLDKMEEDYTRQERKKEKKYLLQLSLSALDYLKVSMNEEMPDFEVGHLELRNSHRLLGITQLDIDWINEHKDTMFFFPSKDTTITGFQLLPTGKVIFEED